MRPLNNPFLIFWLFGLINNVLYVVILSAAMDLVNPTTPKSLILLVDILPSLLVKLVCLFYIHRIQYGFRIITLIILSITGMVMVSVHYSLTWTLLGIILASASSGLGEVTFLQLTHHQTQQQYTLLNNRRGNDNSNKALNGWSSGTGGAGLIGSFCYLFLTSIYHISVSVSLLCFAVLPIGFLLYFKFHLDPQQFMDLPNASTNQWIPNKFIVWSRLKF